LPVDEDPSVGEFDALSGKSDHPLDEEHSLAHRRLEHDHTSPWRHTPAATGDDPITRFERGFHRSLDDLVSAEEPTGHGGYREPHPNGDHDALPDLRSFRARLYERTSVWRFGHG
jgi:hypothetical protein